MSPLSIPSPLVRMRDQFVLCFCEFVFVLLYTFNHGFIFNFLHASDNKVFVFCPDYFTKHNMLYPFTLLQMTEFNYFFMAY